MSARCYRSTWAGINLGNLAHNFRQVKRMVSPATKILVTVKADAYGHGLVQVSKKLASCGVDYLGVASIDEGIALRQAGIRLPILVLGVVLKRDIAPLFTWRLIPTVGDEDLAVALNRKAGARGKPMSIHIKVDTGMGRIGVLHYDALELVKKIHKLKFINIEGIFTHFAFADMNRAFTLYQTKLFAQLLGSIKAEGIDIPLAHTANSMGTIGYKNAHFNMVRPGLVIYGIYPKKNLKLNLKPVLSLKSRVVFVKQMPAGHGVSYGHEYVTKKNTCIATIPIGYGDGYPRNLSNKAPLLIKGRRFKVCGRVCMDQIMVDVGSLGLKVGEEVVLIGSQGENRITAEDLAKLSNTISYEIVCGLGSRIPRVYSKS